MSHYIRLINRLTNETESFSSIDTKICEHFGIPVHTKNYYTPPREMNWYDSIGWNCINKSLAEFADELENDGLELAKAIKWLDENYEYKSWMGQ